MSRPIGNQGEELAVQYLEGLGYKVLERNYRFEQAEVDLVCFEPAQRYELGGEIVFVEVKMRQGTGFGRPEEAVTLEKQRNVMRAAQAFLYEFHLENSPCRFDVVGIILKNGKPEIEHFKHAFWG
jgi:putative endonuclease